VRRFLEISEQLQDTQAALAQVDRAISTQPVDQPSRSLLLTAASLKKRRRELEQEFLESANRIGQPKRSRCLHISPDL
jgi:hypothetical protein